MRRLLYIFLLLFLTQITAFAHQFPITPFQNNVAAATYDNYIRDTVKFNYPVQTIYKDQNDNYIAVLQDGTEKDVTPLLASTGRTMVEDAEGNKMVVTSDHRLMSAEQYHRTGKNSTLIKDENNKKDRQISTGEVFFKPSNNQQYGFDAYDASTNNHPEIYPPIEGGSYRPAYKSVAQWQQDKVTADPIDGVTFRSQMGTPYAIVNGDIVLHGEPQPGETPVYAHVAETDSTTKVVGKLNLLTFEPREISVCLVPVNGATPPNAQTLEKELNKIFKPAVASVKLSTATPINIQYANGSGFVHGGSGLLSVYSEDEKAAINAMTDADDDTYYLFLVKNVTKLDADGNRTIVSGYMPVGYQHGFIFEQFDVARTIAHELSHGAFALHHTFSANTESFRADEGTTNNLMDYTEHGIALNHKQWRWMHENHGKGLFGFLADESEGEVKIYEDKCWENRNNWDKVQSNKLTYLVNNKKELQYDASCMYEYAPGSYRYYYKLINGGYFVADKVWSSEDYDEMYYQYDENSNLWRRVNMSDYTDWCLKCELDELVVQVRDDVILSDEAKAIAKIGVGIIALGAAIPTGGTSLSAFGALFTSFEITAATYSIAAGMAQLTVCLADRKELLNKIPSGYLNATVGVVVEYTVENKKVVKTVELILNVAENGKVTFSGSGVEILNDALSLGGDIVEIKQYYDEEK